ncbi:MAG: outer membrane lipoprotein chaperone LolA [Nitrospinae bacterium]|nr:outer membrane lipoprotein chaperone LolA [Nitrospinota bacterium]MBI3813306.1 outer membrane lipoprotein chaperone LolA [Nitrospinota bacterium]
MIARLHILSFLSIIILLSADTSNALTLDEVVDRVQEGYERTGNFQADFIQTSFLKTIKKKQVSKGRVFIKKPGMMRWEYKEPEEQFIISDGKVIWFYVSADKQVMISNAGNAADSHALNIFLSGSGRLRDTFKIEFEDDPKGHSERSEESQSQYLLRLIPKKSQPNMTKLVIGVNKEDFKIETSIVYDIYGNQTIVNFSNIEMNKGLPEDLFHFDVPKGVRIITHQ